MDTFFYSFVGLLFAAVTFLLEGVYTWWSTTRSAAAKRIEQRLRHVSAAVHADKEQRSILKTRYLNRSPAIERLLQLVPRIQLLRRILEQSGLGWSVPKFLTATSVSFVIASLPALGVGLPAILAFVSGLCASLIPLAIVLNLRSKRLRKFEMQLPEAADLISRALRAGHALPSAMQMVQDEMSEPIGGEFRIVFDEINYGVPMETALSNLATRVPLTDLRYFIVAILIQRESGGNLAEILDKISHIIRERMNLLGRVRVLSAEGKMSAWILGALPFAVGLTISILNPKYISLLWTDPEGLKLMGGAGVMILIGVIWMRHIIRIRV